MVYASLAACYISGMAVAYQIWYAKACEVHPLQRPRFGFTNVIAVVFWPVLGFWILYWHIFLRWKLEREEIARFEAFRQAVSEEVDKELAERYEEEKENGNLRIN